MENFIKSGFFSLFAPDYSGLNFEFFKTKSRETIGAGCYYAIISHSFRKFNFFVQTSLLLPMKVSRLIVARQFEIVFGTSRGIDDEREVY